MLYKKGKLNLDNLDPDEILADSASALSPKKQGNLEGRMERPLEKWSAFVFLLVILGGIFYLAGRARWLEVTRGEEFFQKSQENRFFTRAIFPARGVIYDRSRKVMVENVPTFGVLFDKSDFIQKGGDLKTLLQNLANILGKDEEFFFNLGFPRDFNPANSPDRIIIEPDLGNGTEIAALAANLQDLPGIELAEGYRRVYADPLADSHILGYVGKPSAENLKNNPDLKNAGLVGKDGLEYFYDDFLRGEGGKKIVEVNSKGAETRFKFTQDPQAGDSLVLTVDRDLQNEAYQIFQKYTGGTRGGSVLLIDPRDGAIRTLVSFPGFDSNKFSFALAQKEFEAVLKNPLTPLFNRAVSGEFPPGSTIKPLYAAAVLQENIIDPLKKIYDEGFIEIPNPYNPAQKSVFLDWRKQGWINFYDAIALSANVYFYIVGGGYQGQAGLGIGRIDKYARAFGLGEKLGLDLPGESPGLVPTPDWKKENEPSDPVWRLGDTYNVSIGQGGMKVTPLQTAVLTAAISNGGKIYQPHLLDSVLDSSGKVVKRFEPKILGEVPVKEENLKEVIKGMRQTVTSGTARMLGSLPVEVAAKTGTAQIGGGLTHAWITAFLPAENPEIVAVVMVEKGGEGAVVAAPILRDILSWYWENRK